MIRWVSFIVLAFFLYQIREVFPPFIVGAIIAYLLFPSVAWLSARTRAPMGLAVWGIYLPFLLSIILIIRFFGHGFAEQLSGLVNQRKEIVTSLLSQLSPVFTYFNYQIDVNQATDEILKSIEKGIGDPSEIWHLGALVSKGLLFMLVTVVSSIYFISGSDRVGQFFLRFLPQERRHTAINLLGEMNHVISKYVRAQLILIALMACVAYFFLHVIFHIKYALVIALLSGFLEIIPVLGPILATTIATLVGISQIGVHGFLLIPCYIGARWVEDYVVVPKIMSHEVKLHALAVIFAVLCGETIAGALGVLIAIPVAASIRVVLDFCYPALPPEDSSEPATPA